MNDLVRFSQGVQMATGRKRGRPPVFNSRMFYPYKEELRLRLLLKKELERYIAEAYAVAVQGETFSDDLNALSNLGDNLPEDFRNEVKAVGQSIARHVSNTIANSSEMIVGKPYYPPNAKEEIYRTWEANFQTLCMSAESDAKKEISRIVSTAKNEGWSGRQLEKAVKKELPAKYAHRAELIARTESAKLNSEVTRATYREIGGQYYKWMATPDERTRPDHAAMNGVICSVDDPTVYFEENPDDPLHPVEHPRTGEMCLLHPGEDFQCRCTMVMWDPEIDGQYEVKETPEPEEKPEEKEPTELERAKEELSREKSAREEAEKEAAKNLQEAHELKSKVTNFEKMIRAESAQTRQEQIEITESLFKNVDKSVTAKLVVASLMTLNKEVSRNFAELGIDKLSELALYDEKGVAAYGGGVLYINADRFNKMALNPKDFFEMNVVKFQKRRMVRFLAIDNAEYVKSYVLNHEFGHYLFEKYEKINVNAHHELYTLFEKAKKHGDVNKISGYALEDVYEFFAEMYAMSKNTSCDLPNYLLDFVKKVAK